MARGGKGRPKKTETQLKDKPTPEALRVLRIKKAKLQRRQRVKDWKPATDEYIKEDWVCPKLLYIHLGYDLLENWIFASKYVEKKYDFQRNVTEALLYLYPRGYWTVKDFNALSVNGYGFRIPTVLVKKGLAKMVAHASNQKKIIYPNDPRTVYTLTPKGREAVEMLYKLLSGEMKYPTEEEGNVCANTSIKSNTKRYRTMMSLNKLEPSDNKKRFHTKNRNIKSRFFQFIEVFPNTSILLLPFSLLLLESHPLFYLLVLSRLALFQWLIFVF